MNRTITMNLGGIIFHINEDAYEKLHRYLTSIRSYFKNSQSKDEIMSDIESRVAEMLQEKVSVAKQAILIIDVENVISIMGKPEEFSFDEGLANEDSKDQSQSQNNNNFQTKRKRIFRNIDEKIAGGVCVGIANYFDFDPLWLRGAFAVSFFAFGTGFLLYIILWIVIPSAKTIAEKLEMKGEKVDINTISKAVNEEFEDLKKRVQKFENEVKSPKNKNRLKLISNKLAIFFKDIIENIFRIMGKTIAVISVFLGMALIILLFVTVFGRATISAFGSNAENFRFSIYDFCSTVLPNVVSVKLVITGLFLFIGIPLLMLIVSGMKFLLGLKQKNKPLNYSAATLWILGLGILLFVGLELANDFSDEAITKQKIEILQPKNNMLYIDINPSCYDDLDLTYFQHRRINFGDWVLLSKDETKFKLGYPALKIVASESDRYELIVIKSANGFNKKEAIYKAKNIEYNIISSDSTLLFNNYFEIKVMDKLRSQEIQLILKVPINKAIYISKQIEKIIFDLENVSNTNGIDFVNRKWLMTEKGLQCMDCQH